MHRPAAQIVFATAAALSLGTLVLGAPARPFQWNAEVATALAFGAAAVVLVAQRRGWASRAFARRARPNRSEPRHSGLSWALWLLPGTLFLALELAMLTSAPRASHPTLSSLLDGLDSHWLGRSLAILLWLAFGFVVVTS